MTLLEWMKKEGVTYRWVIYKTGTRYSRQWLSQVFHGKVKPNPELVKKLEKITGLKENEFWR